MQWNPEDLRKALNATLEIHELDSRYFFQFSDNRLKYYLDIQELNGIVIIAGDFEEPFQGMPLFEYSFNCNIIEVKESTYVKGTNAVFFYEHKNSADNIRLTLNIRQDGNWYLWMNTWKNLE